MISSSAAGDFAIRSQSNMLFSTGGNTERMRIDSSGRVGIGIDPSYKLEIKSSGAGNYIQHFVSSDGVSLGGFYENADTDALFFLKNASGAIKVEIDSDGDSYFNGGNVGIGTTSPYTNLEVAGSGLDSIIRLYAASGTANIRTWEMRAVGVAGEGLIFRQVNDANNSYTNRMLIDTDGNVGIGTTSPSSKLTVSGVSPNLNDDENAIRIENHSSSAASPDELGNGIVFAQKYWSGSAQLARTGGIYGIKDASNGSYWGGLAFYTQPSGVTTDMVQRMRITSGGDVEITGGYSSAQSFQSTGSLRVSSNSTATNGNVALELMNDATGTRYLATFTNLNGVVGSISTYSSATSYNTSSDYRLKEDLQDFNGLEKVSKIPVYNFKWKIDDNRSYGVIAHELQEVLPQAVTGDKDAEEMQSVDYSKIVPLLVKSIQELKAEVDKLKQECKCKN